MIRRSGVNPMAGEQAVLYRSIETLMRDGTAAGLDDAALIERLALQRVQVGGTGRPVVGGVWLPQGFSLNDLVADEGNLSTPRIQPHLPDDYPDYSDEQQRAWYDRFYKTAEGKAHLQGESQYAVDLQCRRFLPGRGCARGQLQARTPFPQPTPARRGGCSRPRMPGSRCRRYLEAAALSRWTWGLSSWRSSGWRS